MSTPTNQPTEDEYSDVEVPFPPSSTSHDSGTGQDSESTKTVATPALDAEASETFSHALKFCRLCFRTVEEFQQAIEKFERDDGKPFFDLMVGIEYINGEEIFKSAALEAGARFNKALRMMGFLEADFVPPRIQHKHDFLDSVPEHEAFYKVLEMMADPLHMPYWPRAENGDDPAANMRKEYWADCQRYLWTSICPLPASLAVDPDVLYLEVLRETESNTLAKDTTIRAMAVRHPNQWDELEFWEGPHLSDYAACTNTPFFDRLRLSNSAPEPVQTLQCLTIDLSKPVERYGLNFKNATE